MVTETPTTMQSNAHEARRLPMTAWHFAILLIVAGLGVTGYLSYVKFTATPMICVGGGIFDCSTVQNSSWSTMLGIPIAYLGLAMYIFVGGLLLLENSTEFMRENALLIQFTVLLLGWLYSMFLVYLQFFVLEALCQWCLMHELIITILFGVTIYRLWGYFTAEPA